MAKPKDGVDMSLLEEIERIHKELPPNPLDAFEVVMCLLAAVCETGDRGEKLSVISDWLEQIRSGAAYKATQHHQ
jgi:hypothetical protein